MPIARFGNAQFAARLPTLIRRRGQASEGAHLLGDPKITPGKKCHHREPRALHSDAPQREELAHLGEHRVFTTAPEGPPLGLQRLDVRGEKADLLPRALEAGPQGGRQWGAIPLMHLVKLGVHIALQCELHAMACYQASLNLSGFVAG
jgi:hypothetical protein